MHPRTPSPYAGTPQATRTERRLTRQAVNEADLMLMRAEFRDLLALAAREPDELIDAEFAAFERRWRLPNVAQWMRKIIEAYNQQRSQRHD